MKITHKKAQTTLQFHKPSQTRKKKGAKSWWKYETTQTQEVFNSQF